MDIVLVDQLMGHSSATARHCVPYGSVAGAWGTAGPHVEPDLRCHLEGLHARQGPGQKRPWNCSDF